MKSFEVTTYPISSWRLPPVKLPPVKLNVQALNADDAIKKSKTPEQGQPKPILVDAQKDQFGRKNCLL
jgi:hypothetical protein